MERMKTFFIYALCVIAFFIFSQIMIYFSIHTTYHTKAYEVKTSVPITVEVQATSVNGVVRGSVLNNTQETIENQYLQMDFYSKQDNILGTKYVPISHLEVGNEQEYEMKFNLSRVDHVVLDIVDTIPETVTQEQTEPDPEMQFAVLVSALVLLMAV